MDYKIVRKENQKERLWSGGISKELYIYLPLTVLFILESQQQL